MNLPQRHTIRLTDYDYSQNGFYFVTVCCQDKICRFGKIYNNEVVLNEAGEIARQCWLDIPHHFPRVFLHDFIVMPNHIHGILEIKAPEEDEDIVGAKNLSPEEKSSFKSPSKTIGSVVRGFKIGVSKWIRNNRAKDFSPLQQTKSIWQRNYYEHIIRNEASYRNISDYIISNPYNWINDNYHNE